MLKHSKKYDVTGNIITENKQEIVRQRGRPRVKPYTEPHYKMRNHQQALYDALPNDPNGLTKNEILEVATGMLFTSTYSKILLSSLNRKNFLKRKTSRFIKSDGAKNIVKY